MSLPLATVITHFLERSGLASKTIQSYESTFTPLLKHYGSWPIELLDRPLLEDYLNSLNHLSYTTHRRHQATLQALFNFATRQGHLKANPIAHLQQRKPDPDKGEHRSDQIIRYLTPEQLNILYQSVRPNLRLHAIVRLLHRSGARIAELLALNLTDLDPDHQRFQVLGKGNKQRWCFYSDDAADVLNDYVEGDRPSNHPALFSAQHPKSHKTSRLSYRRLHTLWQSHTQHIPQLTGSRLHDLRHTYATERVGIMNLEELRALMGHENIQTTLRYQKVTSAQAERAAKHAFNALTNPLS